MKLACTPFSLAHNFRSGDMNLRKFIDYCAGLGLEGVDLMDSECYPWSWSSPEDHTHYQQWIADAGLEIAAYNGSNNFAITDPEKHRAQVELVKRSIERTADSCAPVLRIFGGYHASAGGEKEMTTERGITLVLKGLENCLPTAEKHGVILALENHGQLPGFSSESLLILQHFRSPWLRATFDVGNYLGNSMPEDEDPLAAYEALREYVAHVHLKDVRPPVFDPQRRREPCVTGLGITPLAAFMDRLKADHFSGFSSLEYSTTPALPEAEGVTASLIYLKGLARSEHSQKAH